MANHPTPLEEEDIIEQTIHRELARQKLPPPGPRPSLSRRTPRRNRRETATKPPPRPPGGLPASCPASRCCLGRRSASCWWPTWFQLRQDNARYTQLEEDLASIESILQTRDPMAQEIGELEQEVYILTESNSALYDRLQKTTMEAMAFRILCYGEIYLNTRDYYNATLGV